jgi:hypothetical protein
MDVLVVAAAVVLFLAAAALVRLEARKEARETEAPDPWSSLPPRWKSESKIVLPPRKRVGL